MKYRLALFVPRYTDSPSGIAKVSACLLSEFKKIDKIELEVFFTRGKAFSEKIPFLFKKLQLLFSFLCAIPLRLKASGAEIFLSVNGRFPPFISRKKLKAVFIHDLVFKKYPRTMSKLGWLADHFFITFAIKRSDLIIAVSKSTANDISKFYPQYKNKLRIIPLAPAFNNDAYKAVVSLSNIHNVHEPYLLFVGTIEPRKNLNHLLEAYSCLPQELRNKYKLLIAGGEGWGDVNLKKKVKVLNLQKHVVALGYVSEIELGSLYKNAYCLVMPSLYEGFGLPILEAHSFGTPVITSNISSMPEVAGDAAIFVDPFSVKSICSGLWELLESASLRDELSLKAIRNAKKYSWGKTAQLTLDAFKDALNLKLIKNR